MEFRIIETIKPNKEILDTLTKYTYKTTNGKKAKKTGLTYSALIRSLLEDFKPKEKPPEEFYESLNSIRKVGNVINQIAVRMHMLGYVEDEKFLRKTITNLNDMILDIKTYYLSHDKTDKGSVK